MQEEATKKKLVWWTCFFQTHFFGDSQLSVPTLTIEKERVDSLGSLQTSGKHSSEAPSININKANLDQPWWLLLATLLHLMTHLWELENLPHKERTTTWYHCKAFRKKMESLGVICDDKGHTTGLVVGEPFLRLLSQHGVDMSQLPGFEGAQNGDLLPVQQNSSKKGYSKLRKWSCGCQSVRVGKKQFCAVCEICGNRFVYVE